VAEVVFDVVHTMLEKDWVDFATVCMKLIYSDTSAANEIKDTIDAIFENRSGCYRFASLRTRISIFAFQRLLPDASSIFILNSEQSGVLFDSFFEFDNTFGANKSASLSLWSKALGCKSSAEFKIMLETIPAPVKGEDDWGQYAETCEVI
jgi:hypothetical protein